MNAAVAEALAKSLAETESIVAVPDVGQLGYGRDLACVVDVADDFREVAPSTPQIVIEAIARRFQTPRGTLLDDPDYGFDLRGRLHVGLTQQQLRSLQSACIGEAKKDERVETVSVLLSFGGGVLQVGVTVTPRDPRVDPFRFVLRVTSEQVLIDGVG